MAEALPARYKKSYLLTKSNNLVTLHANLTPISYKLMNYILWAAVHEGRLDNLQFSGAEIARVIGIKDGDYTKVLRNESRKITRAIIEMYNPDTGMWDQQNIMSNMHYEAGVLRAKVNSDMRSHIMDLTGQFTPLELERVNACGTYPAMRMYEVCRSWKRTGQAYYSVEEWRGLLGATKKSYDVFSQFKKYVLLPAVDVVNEITDINVEPEYIKAGRKTTNIIMHIKSKNTKNGNEEINHYIESKTSYGNSEENIITAASKENENVAEVEQTKDFLIGLTDQELDCVKRMVDIYSLNESVAVKYVKGYGILYCQENMEYVRNVKKAGNAHNPGGYLVQALEKDYAGSHKAIERAKEKEKAEHADKAEWNRTAREGIIPERENNQVDNEAEKLQSFRRALRVELNQALTAGRINFSQYQKIWEKAANDEKALLGAIETKNINTLLDGMEESNLGLDVN